MGYFSNTYGVDWLSIFLLLLASIFNSFRITRILGIILVAIVIFRFFSKNIYKRSQEEFKFTSFINNTLLSRFGKRLPNIQRLNIYQIPNLSFLKNSISQRIHYKIVKCPNCSQRLRLPRGKKKIIVTCKRCLTEFKMKT